MFSSDEIIETVEMVDDDMLDIRTVTLGIRLRSDDPDDVYDRVVEEGGSLVDEAEAVSSKYGVPIVNKRVSVTPVGSVLDDSNPVDVARALDDAADEIGVDFLGGFGALVEKGFTEGDKTVIESLPEALDSTERVCSSVNIATTKSGINAEAARIMGETVHDVAERSPEAAARLVTFANAPPDNPFMAGAFHGEGEPETALNIGISGPGVVRSALEGYEGDLGEVSERIKRTAFKITRAGDLIGRETAERMDTEFGIIDLSLAPTPAVGDSIADILEEMGLETVGAHGTTAAVALLNDAVKKGGVMASSYVGGLSGAFIPVSEDSTMRHRVEEGDLSLEKLEAMTSVCSVGLDMFAVPESTTTDKLAGIILDECSIGVVNNKTTGVRVIPGGVEGDSIELGGLLGEVPVMEVSESSSADFVQRGGRIPAPIHSVKN
ncbi:MAG: PFL family protein [Halobacteria archaeon]|nr:PFL family protein [Halobacteria archaeon]